MDGEIGFFNITKNKVVLFGILFGIFLFGLILTFITSCFGCPQIPLLTNIGTILIKTIGFGGYFVVNLIPNLGQFYLFVWILFEVVWLYIVTIIIHLVYRQIKK